MIFLSLPGNETLTETLAARTNAEVGALELRQFPDDETYVRLQSDVRGKHVVLVCTLSHPDSKLLPLYFVSQTCKDLGALSTTLVAPYLAYMRQDTRFQEGEGITSTYFGQLVSYFADRLITVDPHLHRRSDLSEVYQIESSVVHAADAISLWIKDHVKDPIIIGPDEESQQWVSEVAAKAKAPHTVLTKVRRGDRDVEVSAPEIDAYQGCTPVLVDDIISTARTMIKAAQQLVQQGFGPPLCIGVHGIFAGDAYSALKSTGAEVVTCNTIPHESNQIDLSADLARVL